MTFYSWLLKQRSREDRVGDFAKRAKSSDQTPSGQYVQDYRPWAEFCSNESEQNALDQAFYEYMYDVRHGKNKKVS